MTRDPDALRVEIQELFAEMWQVPRFSAARHAFRPQCDCYRIDDPPELHVVVELPGVDSDAIRVAAVGRTLVVAGRRERPRVPGAQFRQMEIEYGELDVVAARTRATYERGMLTVVIPLGDDE
ncbi:MAG: Hsp20/alpha crystallin family protein [Actinobacteria bacterium]|nr:MAG: Hsp20/alpha crystallin family protein [Actinomycetota bacterium]